LELFIAGSCQVLEGVENICGVYVGSLRVYGEDSNALNIIRDHLDRDGTEGIHSDLRRLFSVDMQQNLFSTSSEANEEGISSSAIAGVAVALVTLSVGIIGLVAVQVRSHRRRQSQPDEQDFGSESGRDEIISMDSVELQVETIELEPETALVVSGKECPRSIII
jgi:hypothetical protein